MTATHEYAARELLRSWVSTPEGAQALHKVYAAVARGAWRPSYMDMLGQKYERYGKPWPMEQIACLGQLHAIITIGKIGRVGIRAADIPRPDKERAANALLLADLPEPFCAEVDLHQHHADDDGRLTWSQPIRLQVIAKPGIRRPPDVQMPEGNRDIFGNVSVAVRPGGVPLEIGTTLPSRTLSHLVLDRGVARWPYGSDWIWLLLPVRRWHPEPGQDAEIVPPVPCRAD